jgi:hypothetical protein
MTRNGNQLLADFSVFLDDYWASETTSAGATDASTLVDTAIAEYGNDTLGGGYLRITDNASTNVHAIRRIKAFDPDSGECSAEVPFATAIAEGITYEFHRHDPRRKFEALNRARLLAFPVVSTVLVDESVTGDGVNATIKVPPDMRRGPIQVFGERYTSYDQSWNFMPQTGWVSSYGTVSSYNKSNTDLVLPRNVASCVTWVISENTSADDLLITESQLLKGVTAAALSGRRVTVGAFVYCRRPERIQFKVTDTWDTYLSSYHRGLGWEFLTVSFDVCTSNLVFTAGLRSDGLITQDTLVAMEDVFGIVGDTIPQQFDYPIGIRGSYSTSSNVVELDSVPLRGQQLRLVGHRPISPLTGTHAQQSVGNMDVDEENQELLFAKAARLLFVGEGMRSGQVDEAMPKVQEIEDRYKNMKAEFGTRAPYIDQVKVW